MKYFDDAASAPMLPEVKLAMADAFDRYYANPHAQHESAVAAMEAISAAQELLADKIGADPSEIIFTSGASEANNLAIKGLADANRHKGRHIITSKIEHKCILNICSYLEGQGFEVTYLDPTEDGVLEVNTLKNAIRDDTILVSLMHVNNEIGTIQPLAEIGDLCASRDILFHTDAAQSFAKLPIDVLDMNIDAMSVSAHKFGGPKGIGFLYLRDARKSNITPLLHGGGQQMDIRGGTLPTPLIVGMKTAAQTFVFRPPSYEEVIVEGGIPDANLVTTAAKLEGIYPVFLASASEAQKVANRLAVSMGSACNSQSIESSHVLSAMGCSEELSRRFVRLSKFCSN